jgi:hypothetical protein
MSASSGCTCAAFAEACQTGFVEKDEYHFYLANKNTAGPHGTWASVLYGPEIFNCPFCGTPLNAKARAQSRTEAAKKN